MIIGRMVSMGFIFRGRSSRRDKGAIKELEIEGTAWELGVIAVLCCGL